MVKILIVKTSSLGDIVHLFPTIQFLKDIYPQCSIDWVVEKRCASLVQAHPLIQETICIDSRKWKKNFSLSEIKEFYRALRKTHYDVVFDFQGNIKSGIITNWARSGQKVGFGKNSVAEWPNLLFTSLRFDPPKGNIRSDYLTLAEGWCQKKGQAFRSTTLQLTDEERQLLSSLQLRKTAYRSIMVCPGSNWINKQLTEECLLDFLKMVETEGPCQFWLLAGSLEEERLCSHLHSALKSAEVLVSLPFSTLQHWMMRMKIVIAMDSFPLHLAAEANVPTFSFFGPSTSAKYAPLGPNHAVFQGSCPYGKSFAKRCPILRTCPTGACLRKNKSEALFALYKEFTDKLDLY